MQVSEPTVFLRIGSDKAGTVSLASFVVRERETLAELGVYAPIRNCVAFLNRLVNENNLKSIQFFSDHKSRKLSARKARIIEELLDPKAKADWNTVYLTTESFWGRLTRVDPNEPQRRSDITALIGAVQDRFPDHKLRVILHLRRGDRYYESLYNQHVKSGGALKLDDFISRRTSMGTPDNSLALVNLLESSLGRDNVIIKPFEPAQLEGNDVVIDTLHMLGLEEHLDRFKIERHNESLHRVLIEVLRPLNETHFTPARRPSNEELLLVSGFLRNECGVPDSKFLLDSETRQRVLDTFSYFYTAVSQCYLDGQSVFHEPLPSAELSKFEPDQRILSFVHELLVGAKPGQITKEYLAAKWETALGS